MTEYKSDKAFLPYQQDLAKCIDENDVTVVEKSRRTGYSWAIGGIAPTYTAKDIDGMNVYYMGYDLEMARDFIDYVGEWAKFMQMAASDVAEYVFPDPDKPDKDIKAFRVSFASGKEVVALPSVPRALRGKQGLVIIDEASFHDDLAEVLKAAFALLIWGGKVVIISTHNGEDNPFNLLITDILAGKKPYKLLRCTFDDALKQGLYKRICAKSKKEWSIEKEYSWRKSILDFYGDDANEELFCIPSKGSGRFLTRALIEKCMKAGIEIVSIAESDNFALLSSESRIAEIDDWLKENITPLLDKLNPQLQHGFGFDFARSSDLSVLWVLNEEGNLNLNTCFVVEIRNMPHEQQKQILFYIISRLPRFRRGVLDAGGNGSYVAEVTWQEYGDSYIEKISLTVDWYRQNTPRLKAALEDQTLTLPKNENVLNDFKLPRVVKGVATIPDARSKDEQGNKRHGDSFIACSLAVYAMKSDGGVAYEGCQTVKDLKDQDEDDFEDFNTIKGCL